MSSSSLRNIYSVDRNFEGGQPMFMQNNFVSPYSNSMFMRVQSELPKQRIKVKSKLQKKYEYLNSNNML